MFAALSALDNSGDKTSGRPVIVATTTASSTGTPRHHAFRYVTTRASERPEARLTAPLLLPITGTSSKKKKKKGGGGGGANANDAMLAERMQRLMAPLPSREPAPEQWSKVEKGAGVAKSAAKNVARGLGASTTSKPTAMDPSFSVLRKFTQPEDDGDGGDDGDGAGAVDLDSYSVSAPFMHVFEDTGASAWCCIVTSASGFDSPPVPIAAAVPRVRKVKSASEMIALEKEEKREVVTEFRRRQREARKAEKANKPKKKKKKKGKGNGDEPGDGDEGEEPPAVATVSVDAPDSHKAADREALSGSIASALFARAPRQSPDDASPQPQPPRQTQELTQAQVRAYQQQQTLARQQILAQQYQPRSDGRTTGPPPGLGGIAPAAPPPPAPAAPDEEGRRFLQEWSAPAASEQHRLMEAQSAQMAEMQRQLAEALAGQEEAKRLAGQAQAAAVAAAAAAAAAQAQAQKEAGMRKDWRGGAGSGGGAAGGRRPRGDGKGGGRGGPPPGFGANATGPPGFGGSVPPGFEAPGLEAPAAPPTFGSNSYVPPAFRRAKE